ncbi:hypothetical protein JIY74_32860 [Vibrio harveyi]|nr:hypothetical protein [Vibrio harveyi]
MVVKADDILNLFAGIIGLFGVSVTCIYILGVFTKRTSNIGAIIGGVCGLIIIAVPFVLSQAKIATNIDQFYFIILAFIVSLSVGYLSSFIFKNKKINELDGLTIHTFSKQDFNQMVEEGEKE